MMSRQRFIEGLEMDSSASWSEIRAEIAWRAEVLGLPKRTPFRELCAAWRMREEDIDLYEQEYGYPMDAPGYQTNIRVCETLFEFYKHLQAIQGSRSFSQILRQTCNEYQTQEDKLAGSDRFGHNFPGYKNPALVSDWRRLLRLPDNGGVPWYAIE